MNIKKHRPKLNTSGFSLVELMVVVAIIGVLASIAAPTFTEMANKARQAEAKEALSGMYTAETAFYADQGSYTCCLYQAGYEPEGLDHYYTTGFWWVCPAWTVDFSTGQACGVARAWGRSSTNDATYIANLYANPALQGTAPAQATVGTSSTFSVFAFGSISATNNFMDMWSIDQSKVVKNFQNGL